MFILTFVFFVSVWKRFNIHKQCNGLDLGWVIPALIRRIYFMDNDIAQSIEKHMEGTNLGLAALAEVLAKMDARLSEDEEADYEEQLQLEEYSARTELVKEIAGEVFEVLKAEGAGIGVGDSKTTNKAEQGNLKGGADSDDSSKTISPDTSTATAGRPTESPTGSSLDHDSPGGSQLNTTSQKEDEEGKDDRRKRRSEDPEEELRDLRLELEDLKSSINAVSYTHLRAHETREARGLAGGGGKK